MIFLLHEFFLLQSGTAAVISATLVLAANLAVAREVETGTDDLGFFRVDHF